MLKILKRLFGAAEPAPQDDKPPLGDPRGLFAQDVRASKQYWTDFHAPPSRRIVGNAKELGADPTPGGTRQFRGSSAR
jgi:hypothetical protein